MRLPQANIFAVENYFSETRLYCVMLYNSGGERGIGFSDCLTVTVCLGFGAGRQAVTLCSGWSHMVLPKDLVVPCEYGLIFIPAHLLLLCH